MAKLVHICASKNDLFGLDDDGVVYHYNFNTNHWMKLGRGRSTEDDESSGERRTAPTTAPSPTAPRRARG